MEALEETSETYAPQSPDLSAAPVDDTFVPHPQHREYRGSVSFSPFTPTDAQTPFGFPSNPRASTGYTPTPQATLPIHPLEQSQTQQVYYQSPQQGVGQSPVFNQQLQGYNPYFAGAVAPPPLLPQQALHYGLPPQQQFLQQNYQFPPLQPQSKQEESYGSQQHIPDMAPARGGKKAKQEEEEENSAPGVREGIEVRTKFPVARIKRIMQADEDVGKVAQVTPVAVSKALELFMISLVTKAATQAKERGSKRVLAAHLKQAVLEDKQFDYLIDIVSKVAEAPAKNADKQEDSDEAMDAAPAKRKRATGGGRKKRKGSDE